MNKITLALCVLAITAIHSVSHAQANADSINSKIMRMENEVSAINLRLSQTRSSLKKASNTYFLGLGITVGGIGIIGITALSQPRYAVSGGGGGAAYAIGAIAMIIGTITEITAWGKIHEAGAGYHSYEIATQ